MPEPSTDSTVPPARRPICLGRNTPIAARGATDDGGRGDATPAGALHCRAMPDRTASDDPVLERALLAVGRTRAIGLHFYGNFVGIGGSPGGLGTARISTDGEPP